MQKILKKYLAIFNIGIKNALAYRVELILWSVIDAMPLIAMLVLWLSIYGERSEIAGYSQLGIVSYYIFGYFFQDITGAHYEESVLDQIRQGTISGKLIKPFSLKIGLVVREVGWRSVNLIASVLPVFIFVLIFASEVFSQIDKKFLLIIPLFILMAYLFENIYSLIISAIGFVFEEAYALTHFKWMLGWLFSGSMMPFEFLPEWLSKLSNLLPFKFRYYLPIQVVQGRLTSSEIFLQILLALFWLFILTIFMKLLWKRNIKQFTAVGG